MKWVTDRFYPRGNVWDLVAEDGRLLGFVQRPPGSQYVYATVYNGESVERGDFGSIAQAAMWVQNRDWVYQ